MRQPVATTPGTDETVCRQESGNQPRLLVYMRRPERIGEQIREEISQIVGFELTDPRLLAVTVTDVKIAQDLRDARVFVTVAGDEAEHTAALAALRRAAPYIRRQIGTALSLRHTPALHFVRDIVEERAVRIDELLAELQPQTEHPPNLERNLGEEDVVGDKW